MDSQVFSTADCKHKNSSSNDMGHTSLLRSLPIYIVFKNVKMSNMTATFDFLSEILLGGACNTTTQCKDQNANCVGGASNKMCTCLDNFYSYEAKCIESMCYMGY